MRPLRSETTRYRQPASIIFRAGRLGCGTSTGGFATAKNGRMQIAVSVLIKINI
jgi:hypothetical protein